MKISQLLFFTLLPLLVLTACDSLRESKPIMPVKEYERLMVGNFMADYVGNDNCLAKCHKHDEIKRDFEVSVHGDQISAETGLPLVNCESCHGPGSLAIEHAENNGRCDTKQFLQLREFPSQAKAQICLKCHAAASTPNLTFWHTGIHANSGVSCFDCHNLHEGPTQKVSRKDTAELCYGCHQNIKMQFSQFSHHPVPEGKVVCTDCHNPHGSSNENMLIGSTVKETCTRCHMDKQGPFVYEHADVTEKCTNCHRPHGSPVDPLLTSIQPFLCMQCHSGHLSIDDHSARGALSSDTMKQAFFNRCTDCHSAIHGTDIPSSHGRGTFIAR